MTNMHRADENGMITDLSKVSNSDTADVEVPVGWLGQKIRYGASRSVLMDHSQREGDAAVINTKSRFMPRVNSTLTK